MKELTQSDIKGIMGKFYLKERPPRGALLFISAEWCGHCKRVKPELLRVSRITSSGFPIFILDADKNKELLQQMKVNSFPTIKHVLPSGLIDHKYEGVRTAEDILDYICQRAKKCYGNR